MMRYSQSALSAMVLHIRGQGKPVAMQQARGEGVKQRQGSTGGGLFDMLITSISIGQVAVTEVAKGLLKVLTVFLMEVKHIAGLVFWCAHTAG